MLYLCTKKPTPSKRRVSEWNDVCLSFAGSSHIRTDAMATNGGVIEHFNDSAGIALWHVDVGEVVVELNAPNQASRNFGFVGDGTNDVTRANAMIATDVEPQSDTAPVTRAKSPRRTRAGSWLFRFLGNVD